MIPLNEYAAPDGASVPLFMVQFFRCKECILNFMDLEMLSMSEVLKYLPVFVSNCNFHIFILLIINYISQLPSQLENSI